MKAGKNQQVVKRLIEAVSANDRERIQSFLCDGALGSVNSIQKSVQEKEMLELITTAHNDAEEVDWQVDQLVEDDSGRVLTKGCLRYLVNGQWCEYSVNGVFEVKGSKIVQWY